MEDKFDKISISGRYIFAYLCIEKYIGIKKCDFFPKGLNDLLKEFVCTDRLDDWHEKIDEIYPSIILSNTYDSGYFKFITLTSYNMIKQYYEIIDVKLCNLIELLLDLGSSNIYSSFNSNTSLEYLIKILVILKQEMIEPISYEVIKDCSIHQRKGWGDITDIDSYRAKY